LIEDLGDVETVATAQLTLIDVAMRTRLMVVTRNPLAAGDTPA
jgi:hypothetical protein